MRKMKCLSVVVLIALVTNSVGIGVLPGPQLAKAKEPERLVARSLGLTGAAEEEFVKQVEIRELTGKALLQRAVSAARADAKSRVALRYLRQRGYEMLDGTATGLTVVVHSDSGPRSATALLWDYQGPSAEQMATFVHVADGQGLVRVGIGLVELHGGEVRRLRVLEVQGDELIEETAWTIQENGTAVSEGADSLDLLFSQCETTGVRRLAANDDDCVTCISICGALYALGCGINGMIFCTLMCIPFAGPACPLICGGVWLLICVLGGYFGCDAVCGPVGLGYCD